MVTAVTCAITFVASLNLLCGMGFQPSWADGWPVSKHSVFACFVTTVFAVASVSGAGSILILLTFLAELKRPFLAWKSFIVAMMLVFVTVIMACPHVYGRVYTAIVREWP